MADTDTKRPKLAPNEVLLQLFLRLQQDAHKAEMYYVLALLLIRRRLLRENRPAEAEQHSEEMVLFCNRTKETYRVPIVEPGPERIEEIQTELADLLFAGDE